MADTGLPAVRGQRPWRAGRSCRNAGDAGCIRLPIPAPDRSRPLLAVNQRGRPSGPRACRCALRRGARVAAHRSCSVMRLAMPGTGRPRRRHCPVRTVPWFRRGDCRRMRCAPSAPPGQGSCCPTPAHAAPRRLAASEKRHVRGVPAELTGRARPELDPAMDSAGGRAGHRRGLSLTLVRGRAAKVGPRRCRPQCSSWLPRLGPVPAPGSP